MNDNSGKVLAFLNGKVDGSVIQVIKSEGRTKIVHELEMFALYVAIVSWCPLWPDQRIVAFIDIESTRGSFLGMVSEWPEQQSSQQVVRI